MRPGHHHNELGVDFGGGVQDAVGGGFFAHFVEAVVIDRSKQARAAHRIQADVGFGRAVRGGYVHHRGGGLQGLKQIGQGQRRGSQPEGLVIGGHHDAVGQLGVGAFFGHQQQRVVRALQHGQRHVAEHAVKQVGGMLAAGGQQQRVVTHHGIGEGQAQGVDGHLRLGGHGHLPGALGQVGHYCVAAGRGHRHHQGRFGK